MSWILITTGFLIIFRNSHLIMKCSDAKDFEFLLKNYGRFFFLIILNKIEFKGKNEFNSMTFINEIYNFNLKFFVNKESNPSNHIVGSIKYVGENLCKDFIEINLDQELKILHESLRESHFPKIVSQNLAFKDFNVKIKETLKKNGKYIEKDNEFILELLNKLSKMMIRPNKNMLKATNNRSFQEIAPIKKGHNALTEEIMMAPSITSIHLYIHEASLLINDVIKIRIIYGDLCIEKNVYSGKDIEMYEILNYKEGKDIIRLEISQKVLFFFFYLFLFVLGIRK